MTFPSVAESTPPRLTTRRQCTRAAGVVAKYFRRNSGEVEPSPFYSTWFREEIIADQRFERRRRQMPSQRTWSRFNEMEVDSEAHRLMSHSNKPPLLRGKRQVDCKICKTELTEWTNVISPGSCCHLFHAPCYAFWRRKYQPPSSPSSSSSSSFSSPCPVCTKTRREEETSEVTVRVVEEEHYPVPLVLRRKLLSESVDETQDALGNINIGKGDTTPQSESKEDSSDVKNVAPLLEA